MPWASGPGSYPREKAVVAAELDRVMNHHTAVAIAGFWTCYRCLRELGRVGLGMPVTVADCTPRRWADGAA